MSGSDTLRGGLEEIFWAGFPEGMLPLRAPQYLAEVTERFLQDQGRSPRELLGDPVAVNHLAYLMARPSERLRDDFVEQYCTLARYVLRALAMND
ncbi:MAG: hypothetical protein KDN19_17325 [Verrucomicrobiae bacterium]|nr:hypothetical protein [Verrucomicrobiae bacterium]